MYEAKATTCGTISPAPTFFLFLEDSSQGWLLSELNPLSRPAPTVTLIPVLTVSQLEGKVRQVSGGCMYVSIGLFFSNGLCLV